VLHEPLFSGAADFDGTYSSFMDGLKLFHVDSKDYGFCFALFFGIGGMRRFQAS